MGGTADKRPSIAGILRRSEFFNDFSEEELDYFHLHGQFLHARAGHPLIREREWAASFFIVLAGQVEINKGGCLLAVLGPDEIFGEMGALGDIPRTAQVLARVDTVLMQLDPRVLEAGDCPFQLKFYKKLTQVLVRRLTRTSDRLAEAAPAPAGAENR
jgi:CRP-like cAMP-binding protein